VGPAPSAIWRGRVLMRCGPAYGLDGRLSAGSAPQNRVVIDGLAEMPTRWPGCAALLGDTAGTSIDLAMSSAQPFSACLEASSGLVGVRLVQAFAGRASGRTQLISSEGLGRGG